MTLPDDYSVSEIWRSLEDEGKRVRAERRATAPEQLRAAGVAFTLNNNGAHLVITVCPGLVADFWPGTELWRRRGTPSPVRPTHP